jgi:hypothetical protein
MIAGAVSLSLAEALVPGTTATRGSGTLVNSGVLHGGLVLGVTQSHGTEVGRCPPGGPFQYRRPRNRDEGAGPSASGRGIEREGLGRLQIRRSPDHPSPDSAKYPPSGRRTPRRAGSCRPGMSGRDGARVQVTTAR